MNESALVADSLGLDEQRESALSSDAGFDPLAMLIEELLRGQREQAALAREALAMQRELLTATREAADLLRRQEERYQRQQIAQRDEIAAWLAESDDVAGSLGRSHSVLRQVFGQGLRDLIQHIADHEDELTESSFFRGEMVDKYGGLLNHLSTLHGVVRRLDVVRRALRQQENR